MTAGKRSPRSHYLQRVRPHPRSDKSLSSLRRVGFRLSCLPVLLALLTGLAGCARTALPLESGRETPIAELEPASLAAGEELHVVVTTTVAADLTRAVAGESAQVTSLLPAGVDPHAYEPAPQDVRTVAEADAVFINGLGLEEFLAELLANAGGGAPVVSLSEGIQPRALEDLGLGEEHNGEEAHSVDPHVWLDPVLMITWADNIGEALAALDPSGSSGYRERASALAQSLESLDEWIRLQVEALPPESRLLVTDHDELGYFADRYGFRVIGAVIPGYSSAAEPSAQELADLETRIQSLGVRAVFVDRTVNSQLAERVAEDTGVRLVPLNTHSIGVLGGGMPDYDSLMRYNVEAIVAALSP